MRKELPYESALFYSKQDIKIIHKNKLYKNTSFYSYTPIIHTEDTIPYYTVYGDSIYVSLCNTLKDDTVGPYFIIKL